MTSRCVLVFLVACGGDSAPSSPDANDVPIQPDAALTSCDEATSHADFAWLQANVFTTSCAVAMCHAGPEPEVGLDLSAGAAYANLVGKGSSTQAGWTRVVPGSLAQSYLAVSLGRAAGPPPRDGFMPLKTDPLCVEKLQAVERWILGGAPP